MISIKVLVFLLFLTCATISFSTIVENEDESMSTTERAKKGKRVSRRKSKGCFEQSAFDKWDPPAVQCSPARCSSGFQSLCTAKKVRTVITYCKQRNRRGRCKKLVSRRGFINKCVRKCKPANAANAHGDPHLTAFDGVRFDFQGEDNKQYAVFGRSNGGDFLTTQMREADWWADAKNAKATYFDQFGLTIGGAGNHKLQASIVGRDRDASKFSMRLALDGEIIEAKEQEIELSENSGMVRVEMDGDQVVRAVVTTADAEYELSGEKLWKFNRHLDVKVSLLHDPSPEYKYYGLLGESLNRVLGTEEEEDIVVRANFEDMEQAMRSKFTVDSLFPSIGREINLDVVARISRQANVDLTDLSYSASIIR